MFKLDILGQNGITIYTKEQTQNAHISKSTAPIDTIKK